MVTEKFSPIEFQIKWYEADGIVLGKDYFRTMNLDQAIATACERLKRGKCPDFSRGFIVSRRKYETKRTS